jgi:zinc protease
VGKVAPAEAETLVASHFASLTARAPARPEPAIGALETFSAPKIAVYPNNRAGMEIRAISIVERPASQPWTWEEYLSNLYLRSALAMLEQRFRALTSQPDRIVGDVSTSSQFELLRYRRTTLTLTCSNKNFPAVLALLEQELRRAIELGFSSEEISREQELFRRRQAEAAASLPTRSVSLIAGATVDQIQDSSPLRLPGEPHEQLERYLAEIDSRKCQDALRAAFAPDRLHLFVSSQRNDAPTAAAVREIYEASTRVAVSPLEHSTEKPFAYDDFGPAGAVVEKIHVVDLDIWQLRLSNGVRVNLKRTPYDAGHLQFIARVGYGRLSEPADKPGLGSWLPFWFYGGTQQHTARENLRFLGGLSNIALTAEDDASSIKGRLPAGNLPLALRQITALFSDPAFRKEGWETTRGILRGYTHTLWSKPEGAVARFIRPALAGGDPRTGTIYERQYLARTIDEFQAWFTPQLADSPIEFSLVGDFDPELAMTELTRTLGTLPARKPRDHTPYNTQLTFPEKLRYTRYSYVGTAERPSRIAFYWTFHDTPSLRERRLLRMLAAIFRDRLDDEVREKQGASYTPGSDLFSSETYPGFNYLTAWIDVKSSDARKQSRALQALADKLAKRGITADELARAKAVAITGNNRNRSLNTYWLEGVLASSQQRPERLDAVRSFDSDVNTATIAEMNALAARYYGASKLFKVVIDPSAIMPKKK